MSFVSVRHHPAIVILAAPGEELEAFVKVWRFIQRNE